jgi:hypothetical protein
MLVVPFPFAIVAPDGTVQVYEVALATAAIEYVTKLPVPLNAHMFTGPEIVPGVAGAVLVTEILL